MSQGMRLRAAAAASAKTLPMAGVPRWQLAQVSVAQSCSEAHQVGIVVAAAAAGQDGALEMSLQMLRVLQQVLLELAEAEEKASAVLVLLLQNPTQIRLVDSLVILPLVA